MDLQYRENGARNIYSNYNQMRAYVKDVHRRQKLTTDFFKLFELTVFGCDYNNFEKKNMLTVVSGGSFFKGLDNKIIGFLHI